MTRSPRAIPATSAPATAPWSHGPAPAARSSSSVPRRSCWMVARSPSRRAALRSEATLAVQPPRRPAPVMRTTPAPASSLSDRSSTASPHRAEPDARASPPLRLARRSVANCPNAKSLVIWTSPAVGRALALSVPRTRPEPRRSAPRTGSASVPPNDSVPPTLPSRPGAPTIVAVRAAVTVASPSWLGSAAEMATGPRTMPVRVTPPRSMSARSNTAFALTRSPPEPKPRLAEPVTSEPGAARRRSLTVTPASSRVAVRLRRGSVTWASQSLTSRSVRAASPRHANEAPSSAVPCACRAGPSSLAARRPSAKVTGPDAATSPAKRAVPVRVGFVSVPPTSSAAPSSAAKAPTWGAMVATGRPSVSVPPRPGSASGSSESSRRASAAVPATRSCRTSTSANSLPLPRTDSSARASGTAEWVAVALRSPVKPVARDHPRSMAATATRSPSRPSAAAGKSVSRAATSSSDALPPSARRSLARSRSATGSGAAARAWGVPAGAGAESAAVRSRQASPSSCGPTVSSAGSRSGPALSVPASARPARPISASRTRPARVTRASPVGRRPDTAASRPSRTTPPSCQAADAVASTPNGARLPGGAETATPMIVALLVALSAAPPAVLARAPSVLTLAVAVAPP